MTITIIGHGYVGLITACVFADLGNNVWVVGHTAKKIEKLNQGIPPFFEPGLAELVKHNLSANRLHFTLDFQKAIMQSQIIFICVGTPPKNNGEADLSSVFEVAGQIGKYLKKYCVVVVKSTVPVGTNRKVKNIIQKATKMKVAFDIASCPEFLREGTAIADTLNPDRIVVGTDSAKARDLLLDLHKPISGERILTAIETAEMIKYASNALLATKISFANAIAIICEQVGADAETVLSAVGQDKRLGRSFLYPGVGYGGSCLPKDVKALVATAKKHHYRFRLLQEVNNINEDAKNRFTKKIISNFSTLKGKTLAILGLAFKPNTDDIRFAPSIDIIGALLKEGANIRAYDPEAMEITRGIIPNITYCVNPKDAAKDAHALIVLTEWNEFKQLNLQELKRTMKGNLLFDGRNIYDPDKMKKLGFIYKGIGRA